MKRLPKTLTAAALTGALALGGTAVAQAQTSPPAQLKVGDKEYERQADGSYLEEGKDSGARLSKEDAEAAWEKQQADDKQDGNEAPKPSTPSDSTEDADVDTSDIPAPATKQDKNGKTWYQSTQDPKVYVDDSSKVNEPITDELRQSYTEAFGGAEAGSNTDAPDIPAPATKKTKTATPGTSTSRIRPFTSRTAMT